MDRSACKAIVDREIVGLMEDLGLAHWSITVDFCHLDGTDVVKGFYRQGQCTRQVNYNRAMIELDPENLAEPEDVSRVLLHELLHIVACPFDLFLNAVEPLAGDDKSAEMIDVVWNHAQEHAVINLERMYHALNDKGVKRGLAVVEPPKPEPGIAPGETATITVDTRESNGRIGGHDENGVFRVAEHRSHQKAAEVGMKIEIRLVNGRWTY